MENYSTYIHTDTDIYTVTGFLNQDNGIASNFKGDKINFLNYDGGTGLSNLDRIYSMYTALDKESNPTKDSSIELLRVNTELIFPKSLIDREILSISGKDQLLEQKNFDAFYADSLLKILSDPLYRSAYKIKFWNNQVFSSIYPYLSVWIYSGALNKIIDATPFVLSCSVNVSSFGATFSLNLSSIFGDEFVISGDSIFRSDIYDGKEPFFHRFVQNNDIVFIKFEKLDLEKNRYSQLDPPVKSDMYIDKMVLSGQVFDMIGLVDDNQMTMAFENNESIVTISGRDLMKLIQDDGSYFMPLQFVENSSSLFVNLQDNDKLLKRTFATGDYASLFAFSMRDISTSIQFIINQLANLGIVDDWVDLFGSYGDRRSKVYRIEGDDNTLIPKLHNGIWQIVKLVIDDNVSDRRVADSSISQPDGSLFVQFQKICQEPFVEFFGDTYGDTYNLIVRQPPFTKSAITSVLTGKIKESSVNDSDIVLTVNAEDVISQTLTWENSQYYYSWYEILPQASFIGDASKVALAHVPIVYLPQYADKWGMKKMSVVSNYISNKALVGKDGNINADLTKEAIINDFKLLIDSHSYLPFTRRGTIVINGDRRYKKGTWIRYELTGELFYVDSVTNDFSVSDSSIERTTTLTLIRGMIERFVSNPSVNYFDVVNTDFIKNTLIEQLTSGGKTINQPRINIKSNFLVNQGLFDFFYQRKQFDDINKKSLKNFVKTDLSKFAQ
jgi:hypothetical protein